MKKTGSVIFFILLTGTIMAQSRDSAGAKKVIEKGSKGDLILGKENKKSQLTGSTQYLAQKDSSNKQTSTERKKKKSKTKGRK